MSDLDAKKWLGSELAHCDIESKIDECFKGLGVNDLDVVLTNLRRIIQKKIDNETAIIENSKGSSYSMAWGARDAYMKVLMDISTIRYNLKRS